MNENKPILIPPKDSAAYKKMQKQCLDTIRSLSDADMDCTDETIPIYARLVSHLGIEFLSCSGDTDPVVMLFIIRMLSKVVSWDDYLMFRKVFTNGYCYHFAEMLKATFGRGEVCWLAPSEHIAWVDDGIAYDIDGITRTHYDYAIPMDETKDMVLDFLHIPGLRESSVSDMEIMAKYEKSRGIPSRAREIMEQKEKDEILNARHKSYDEADTMTTETMLTLFDCELLLEEIELDEGIYEFYEKNGKSIGISYETSEDTGKPVYIFNLFLEDEYINIDGEYENPNDAAETVAKTWNETGNEN